MNSLKHIWEKVKNFCNSLFKSRAERRAEKLIQFYEKAESNRKKVSKCCNASVYRPDYDADEHCSDCGERCYWEYV